MVAAMLPEAKEQLISLFGERVAFHQIERMLYSSDLEPLPEIVEKLIVTRPDAVVQPDSPKELSALLDLCLRYRIPLVPRGSGTSWFGGCVPTKGGIVVDFHRMNKVIEISKEKRTAVVEAGTVWKNLEEEMRTHGLALRLYPSSAISSTVGGWIANGGGVGIGSFEYGRIKDNILEIELVTPKGTKRLTGDEVNLAYGMCGTTGLISQVTLAVKDFEDDSLVLAAFTDLDNLQDAFTDIRNKKLALWHVSYVDPIHVKLTRQAVEKQAQKAFVPEEVTEPRLPENKFLAMFVYPVNRESKVKAELLKIIKAHGGEVLSQELAGFQWEERFYPMRMKALGPSLVASEVTVPAQNVAALTRKIKSHLMSQNIAFEGTLINGGAEALVTQYELDDERRLGFPLTMPLKLAPLVVGKKLKSQPYGIGMFLTDYAELMFGKDTLLKAYEFKKALDPDHIINPGKVFPAYLDKHSPVKRLNSMAKSTKSFTRAIKIVDKLFGGKPHGEVIDKKTPIGKLPLGKKALWDAFSCARCGYCRTECPQFKAIGWESASCRGKFEFIKNYIAGKTEIDERMAEMLYSCTTCEQCNVTCQLKNKAEDDWSVVIKPAILRAGFVPPVVTMKQVSNVLVSQNSTGASQDKRVDWMTPDLKYKEEGEIGYFAGCQVSYNYILRNLPINAFRILNKAGIEPVYLGPEEWCCGGSMFYVGCTDEVMEKIEHNIKEFKRRGIKTLITSCSGCWANLSHYYQIYAPRLNLNFDVKMKHITQIADEFIKQGKIVPRLPVGLTVTYHDPCHIGRAGGIYQPPRDILKSIPDLRLIEMPHNREHSSCCGRHLLRYPRLGKTINISRVTEAAQTGALAVISSCPTCENNFRTGISQTGARQEVVDIMDLVAYSAGLPVLAVSKLPKLLHSKRLEQPKIQVDKTRYLTDKEVAREESLFAPVEPQYKSLEGKACDIREFAKPSGQTDNMPRLPSSC